jgi:hypothetical protein
VEKPGDGCPIAAQRIVAGGSYRKRSPLAGMAFKLLVLSTVWFVAGLVTKWADRNKSVVGLQGHLLVVLIAALVAFCALVWFMTAVYYSI